MLINCFNVAYLDKEVGTGTYMFNAKNVKCKKKPQENLHFWSTKYSFDKKF